jgi:hypothetical protein
VRDLSSGGQFHLLFEDILLDTVVVVLDKLSDVDFSEADQFLIGQIDIFILSIL